MSVIDLSKGANINLTKDAPGVTRFIVGLGWNANPNNPPDLDASVLPCTKDASGEPKLPDATSFVFYGNLKSSDGAIIHSGDNLTGDGDGDDERELHGCILSRPSSALPQRCTVDMSG